MSSQNEMKLIFDARSVNESFARVAVAAFLTQLNPPLEEVADFRRDCGYQDGRVRSGDECDHSWLP